MVRLVELKEKYRQALKAIDKEGVRLSPKPLDLKENKLFIEGLAPSHQAKNHVFDEIKAIDTNYESDLICHLTVATAKVINVTPLTLYANLAEVKGGATIDCEFLIAGLIEIGFFAPERPESPYCRLETKEVKEGSTLKIDPNLLCERWPYNWRTAEPWVYLLNVEIAYRELKTPPPFDRKQFFQSVIVTNNTGQYVDAYRVY